MSAIVLNQLLYRAKHDPAVGELIRSGEIDVVEPRLEPEDAEVLLNADLPGLASRGVIPNLLLVAARIHAIPAGEIGQILSAAGTVPACEEDEET